MARIPLVTTKDGLSAEQQAVFDRIVASRGGVRGPFGVALRTPAVASAMETLGGYLRSESRIDRTVRECVMAAAARLLECEFEWVIHRDIAFELGVDAATVADIEAKRLDAIPGDIGLACRFAESIIVTHKVPTDLFEAARKRWGDDALVDLAAHVGYFGFLAAVINTFEVEPPTKPG